MSVKWKITFALAVLFQVLTSLAAPEVFCPCPEPNPQRDENQIIKCRDCGKDIKVCDHHPDRPPEKRPLERCPDCSGWWHPEESSHGLPPRMCLCSLPVPFRDGSIIRCFNCKGVVKACSHHSGMGPVRYPLERCSRCSGWWHNMSKYCSCSWPELFRQNGLLLCRRCSGKIRICRCPGSKPPTVNGNIERCPTCGKWRTRKEKDINPDDTPVQDQTKDQDEPTGQGETQVPGETEVPGETQVPDKTEVPGETQVTGGINDNTGGNGSWWDKIIQWFSSLWYNIKRGFRSYTLTDWGYFFKYLFTSYHLQCADPNHMTPREFYINSVDSMFKGTFKAANELERETVSTLYGWSFLGMRLCFFVGNTIGSDGQNDYCPVVLHYPFFGWKGVGVLPKDSSRMRKLLVTREKPVTYEWDADLTYFPEPNDDLSRAAEELAGKFVRAVHSGKTEEEVRKMMQPGSPISFLSMESLRRKLPQNGRPGRSASPWPDTRLVPFLIIEGKRARSVRLQVEMILGKLYVTEIL